MPVPSADANAFRDAAQRFRRAEVALFRLPKTAPVDQRDRIISEYMDARLELDRVGQLLAIALKKRWV